MQPAPLHADVAEGPPNGEAFWLQAADGVRLRAGLWRTGRRGTVLMFPGRTEYIEKYGRFAADLAAQDYTTLVIDWRGQGLADHLAPDPLVGHVRRFVDFQQDVAALMAAAERLTLPKPFHLVAHSMGGCIGLRALILGLPVASATFSAPMWGIGVKPHMRPAAWVITSLARLAGLGTRYAPGTGPSTYVRDAPFADNSLTTDADMWAYMCRQVTTHPALALGGPSMLWVNEALIEMSRLRRAPLPGTPTLVALGLQERVVNPAAVRAVMARWPAAQFLELPGSEHEMIMERPTIRGRFLQAALAHFAKAGND